MSLRMWTFAFALLLTPLAVQVRGETTDTMKVVVSVRTYRPERNVPSYHSLYEFNPDGTVRRQLTRGDGFDDLAPAFSPDGTQIAFERRYVAKTDAHKTHIALIDLKSLRVEKLAQERWPAGFDLEFAPGSEFINRGDTGGTPYMPELERVNEFPDALPVSRYFTSPDGKFDLIEDFGRADLPSDYYEDFRVSLRLCDRLTGAEQRLADFPGFEGGSSLVGFRDSSTTRMTPFFYSPRLKVAFFSCHVGSTDGNQAFCADVEKRRVAKLSDNGGWAVPVRGRSAFFFVCESRYEVLGPGYRSVDCSYLDLWDDDLIKTRFSPSPRLGVMGGAAIFDLEGTLRIGPHLISFRNYPLSLTR